jgi:hypothetical protein
MREETKGLDPGFLTLTSTFNVREYQLWGGVTLDSTERLMETLW